jgi:TRAP-type mannitol/chloroaromatic compound transport system permease large subunit
MAPTFKVFLNISRISNKTFLGVQTPGEHTPAGSGPTTQFQNKQKDMTLSFISELSKKKIEVSVMITMVFLGSLHCTTAVDSSHHQICLIPHR